MPAGTQVTLGPVAGGSTRLTAYLATPPDGGSRPGVVVLHEALGVNDIVRRQADRLADAGYLALAPDLFSDGGAARCLLGTFRAMFAQRGKAFADIEACRTYLQQHADGTGKVGVIGFCMGGGFALVAATRGFDASSANYGIPPRNLEKALDGACPIVGSYGASDPMLRGVARKLDVALTNLGVAHDVKEYPGAGHSFLNDDTIGPPPLAALQRVLHVAPVPDAAQDAWARIESFFAEHLG